MPKPKQTPSLRLLSAQRFLRVALSTLKLGFLLAVLVAPYIYTRAGTPTRVEAATSSTLNFQARLYSATGTLVPDGNYHIEFKLHDNISSSGGAQGTCSGSCVWRETRTTGNLVTVRNGYFSVNLGSVTSFPTINWDQDLYLSMNIGGTSGPSWDGEMTPRIKLTAVPYALAAGQLRIDNGTNTGLLQFGAITNNPVISLPDASGTVVLLQNAQTFTGAITFDAAGTGLTVTNNASIGGTLAVTGNTTLTGDLAVNGNTTIGNATTDRLTVTAQLLGGSPLVFQGATDDTFATTLGITDPTANQTYLLPNAAAGTYDICTSANNCASLGAYIQNGTALQTNSNFNIQSTGDGTITAQIRARASQTADLLRFQDSAGTNALSGINSAGNLYYRDGTSGFVATLGLAGLSADQSILLPNAGGTICTTSGNCIGNGGSGDIFNGGQAGPITIGTNDNTTFTLETNNTAVLTMLGSGNVGIGTTAPGTNKLLVKGGALRIENAADVNGFTIDPSGTITGNGNALTTLTASGYSLGSLTLDAPRVVTIQSTRTNDSAAHINLKTAGATRLHVANSGNIGIGTTAPTGLLQVSQTTAGYGTVATNATTTLTGTNTQFLNTFKVGDTITVSGETVRTITAIASNTSLTVGVAFTTTASDLSYTLTGGDRLTVLGNGNIGIGTTAPGAKLQINTTADATIGQIIRANSATQTADLLAIQDSIGTNLTRITSSGYLFTQAVNAGGTIVPAAGQLRLGSGAPSIYFDRNNVNEWIFYQPGTSLFIRDSANARMHITYAPGADSSTARTQIESLLGVGFSSAPTAQIDIRSSTAGTIGAVLRGATSQTADLLQLQNSAGSPLVVVNADGNVGIGDVNTYSRRLHLRLDAVGAAGALLLTNQNGANNDAINQDFIFKNSLGALNVQAQIQAGTTDVTSGSQNTYLAFKTQNDSATLSEVMRIAQNGNVGIGTTNPGSKLELGSGQITVPLGSGVAPSYAFTGDLNTGIYSPIADTLGFTTGGVEALRITSVGNLRLSSSGAVNNVAIGQQNDSDTGLWWPATDTLALSTAGSERLRVDSTGNIGIGTNTFGTSAAGVFALGQATAPTTSPADNVQLYVTDAGAGDARLRVRMEGGGIVTFPNETGTICTTGSVCAGYAAAAANGYVQFAPATVQADSTTNSSIFINKTGASGNILQLQRSGVDKLVVDNSGNVGIGESSPASVLHTVATGAKTANYTGNLLTNTATSSTASINKYGLEIQSTGTWNGAGSSNVGLYVSSVTGGTNNYDAIFNGGGNVGIGTTTPGATLHVLTDGATEDTLVINSGTSTGNIFVAQDNGTPVFTIADGGAITATNTLTFSGAVTDITTVTGENLTLTATGSGIIDLDDIVRVGTLGTADTNVLLCRNSAGQLANCDTTGAGAAFLQGGNTFGGAAVLGTNNNFDLQFETNGTTKLTLDTSGNLTFAQASTIGTSVGALTLQPAAGSNVNINLSGTGDFAVNTDQFYVDTSTGNVGIGTTSPSGARFVVNAPDNITPHLKFQNIGNTQASIHANGSSGYFEISTGDGEAAQSPKLVIERTSGNVGIGTTAPGDILQIGSATGQNSYFDSSTSGLHIRYQTSDRVYLTSNTNTFGAGFSGLGGIRLMGANASAYSYITGGATNELLLNSAGGNVGIGTTSPNTKLDVRGSRWAPLTGYQAVGTLYSTDALGADVGAGLILGGVYTGTTVTEFAQIAGVKANGADSDYGGALTLSTRLNGGNMNERMRIDTNGNVGIGTTSPTALLHMKGTLSSGLTGTVAVTNLSTTVTGTGTAFTTELAAGDSIKIGTEVFTVSAIGSATSLTLDSAYQGATASGLTAYRDPTLFAIDNGDAVNKLTVTRSGNVGIGTAAPSSALDVTGGTHSSGHIVLGAANQAGRINFRRGDGNANFALMGWETATTNSVFSLRNSAGGGEIRLNTSSGTGGPITFYAQNSERMRVHSDGNVGIGTTNPGYRLTVVDDSFTQAIFQSTTNRAGIILNNQTAGQQASFTLSDASSPMWEFGKQTNNSFFIYDNANARDALRISGGDILLSPVGGNVGIGTTSAAAAKLQVLTDNPNGIQLTTGGAGLPTSFGIGRTGIDGLLGVAGASGNYSDTSTQGDIILRSSTANLILAARNGTGAIRFTTGSTDTAKLTITNAGDVGVGITAPDGRFHIQGTVDDQQLIVQGHSTQTNNIFEVKNSGGTVLAAVTGDGILKIGTVAAPTLSTAKLFVTNAEIQDILRVGDGTNRIETDSTTQQLRFFGSAQNSKSIMLAPEFPGAVMTPDGSNNVGTMTSDFCSNSSPAVNTGVCAATNERHNYYAWTANATNDYDIWLKWQVPSDFSGFDTTPIQFYGWRTSNAAGTHVRLSLIDGATGTVCGTMTPITNTTTWSITTYTSSGCAPTRNQIMFFRVELSVGVNGEFARMGEIFINYKADF